jgi:hypothetical protein
MENIIKANKMYKIARWKERIREVGKKRKKEKQSLEKLVLRCKQIWKIMEEKGNGKNYQTYEKRSYSCERDFLYSDTVEKKVVRSKLKDEKGEVR